MYELDKSGSENGIVNGGTYIQTDQVNIKYLPDEQTTQTPQTKNAKDKSSAPTDSKGKDEKAAAAPMVGFGEMFRFADRKDRFLMAFGTVMACLHGAALPCMIIVFGNMTDLFVNDALVKGWLDLLLPNITAVYPNITREYISENPGFIVDFLRANNMSDIADRLEQQVGESLFNQMRQNSIYYAILGAAVMVVGYAQVVCWQTASFNQCQRIRQSLFRSILKQEIGWFDTHECGELNTRLSDDVDRIEAGIGDKLGMFFQYFCGFLAGFVIGFVFGWKLTLVIISVSPLLAASGAVMARLGARLTSQELQAYAKAGAVAEEVLGAMRTVVAFGGQQKEAERYNVHLVDAKKFGIKKGLINGIAMGVVFVILFGSYGLAFWYGSKLTREEEYTAGKVITVFFAVLIGAFSIGNAGPNVQEFANSRGAAHAIYAIIDQVPLIDSSSPNGKKLDVVKGNVEFRNVVFSYPSRPDVPVLSGVNLRVEVGQTVALVGPSGCGKSTTVSLIQRFYDPLEGQVFLDGVELRELNLAWLRQHLGVVSQEPVLFATTIRENISYGREGVTQEEIEKATREANAHNFIMKLPKKYDTLVGERGAQLSGGQKQRIAIARALVRDPRVLLLDEATSALDTESEASVQAALDKACQGRTTIIVAHRLSTVQNADLIAGFSEGAITELGSHDQLMKQQGIYYTLCTNQSMLGDHGTMEDDMRHRNRTLSNSSDKHHFLRLTSTTSSHKGPAFQTSVAPLAETEEELPDPELKRIMRLNAPEAGYIVAGCVGAIVMGGIQPSFAVIFSEILGVFSEIDPEEMERRANLYSGLFAVIGVAAFLAMFTMSYMFSRSGEFLTMRLRQLAFKAYLRQDASYFDDSRNSTGALCARLATDASAVKGATGSRLAALCQSVSAMGAGLGIGFAYSWQLTLLLLAFAPFILVAAFVQMRIRTGNKDGIRHGTEEAGKVAIEAIENIRTVAQLTKEDHFYSDYCKAVSFPYDANRRMAHIQGVAFASTHAVLFFAYAGCYTLGAFLVERGDLRYENMFKVIAAIAFSALSVGQATSFAPDYGKAKTSAAKMFQLIDRTPLVDSYSEEGQKLDAVTGSVELRDVNFSYPTRDTVPVLKGVDLEVNPGQMVALVGSSGCGKSTIIQLIERFYDPSHGSVCLDGHEVTELHVQWFRSQVGIVSQEPILFDRSIRDNIAYGDNSRSVHMDDIIAAATQANIHNFIESLPMGYDTNVGDKGAQLSGGQKQRVAIARALVRNPKILLLDEATSALDTESEKVVQEALDRAQKGRTSIVIAHRLSTIQNADKIHVIENGQVLESGTHSELFALKGAYYRFNRAQQRQMQNKA